MKPSSPAEWVLYALALTVKLVPLGIGIATLWWTLTYPK